MRLIWNWRRAWRFLSVQVAAFAVVWGTLPREYQEAVMGLIGLGPEHAPAFLGVTIILVRLIDQPGARFELGVERGIR